MSKKTIYDIIDSKRDWELPGNNDDRNNVIYCPKVDAQLSPRKQVVYTANIRNYDKPSFAEQYLSNLRMMQEMFPRSPNLCIDTSKYAIQGFNGKN
ncbi:MAG: hypothetical protein ACMXYF_01240 [Candidatus Woesearchaeota archaeon]